MFNKVCICW